MRINKNIIIGQASNHKRILSIVNRIPLKPSYDLDTLTDINSYWEKVIKESKKEGNDIYAINKKI